MARYVGVLVGLLACVACVAASCKKVYKTSVHCLNNTREVELTCPDGYIIDIQDVHYYVTSAPECPRVHGEDGSAPCSLGALTSMYKRQCYGATTSCKVEAFRKADSSAGVICSGTIGAHYVGVKYHCRSDAPLQVREISLCDKKILTGSLLRITSHAVRNDTSSYVRRTPCYCRMEVHEHLQMEFRRLSFNVVPGNADVCAQKVTISGGGAPLEVCQEDWTAQTQGVQMACYEKDSYMDVKYFTNSDQHGVAFEFEVKVHQEEQFTVQCGLGLPDSTVSPLTPGPVSGDDQGDNTSGSKIPLILGVCAGAFVLLVVAIVILLTRRRSNGQQDSETMDGSETGSNFAFVKDVYLEGTVSSRQIVSKDKANTLPGGSLGPASRVAAPVAS